MFQALALVLSRGSFSLDEKEIIAYVHMKKWFIAYNERLQKALKEEDGD